MAAPMIYRVVPVEGGRLMIRSEEGHAVLGDRDFGEQMIAVEALVELARERGMKAAVLYRPDGKVDKIIVGEHIGIGDPDVIVKLAIPAELDDALDEMAETMKVSRDEAARRAITLLKVAFDANRKGDRLAVLSPDDDIIREIVGYGPPAQPQPVGK